MGIAKNFILGILSFFLIIALSVSVVLYSTNVLLYPSVYKESLEKNNVYDSFENFEENAKQKIDSSLENFLSYLRGEKETFDSYELTQIYGLNNQKIEQFKNYVSAYKLVFYSSIIFSLILIFLIFLISGRNFLTSFKFTGISMVFSGISVILAVMISNPILKYYLNDNVQAETEISRNLVSDIFSSVFGKMNFYGYIFLGAGIIIFSAAVIFQKIKNRQSKNLDLKPN